MPLRSEARVPIPLKPRFTTWLEGLMPSVKRPILDVPFQSQRPYRSLCWAACGQMALATVGRRVDMCAFAGWWSGRNCCATNPMQNGCNRTCWPHDAYDALRFGYRKANGPLNQPSLEDEIVGHRRPVQMILEYPGWSHTALIIGANGDGSYVVHDPWEGPAKTCSYQFLLSAFGSTNGVWNRGYYGLGA